MALSQENRDKIRYLIVAEIRKVFSAVLKAANEPPVIGFSTAPENRVKEQTYNKINKVARDINDALRDLESEARARIVEKTDPERAEIIRKLKPEL
ncbi:MAG: hypothetical protein H0W58_12990 [Acidobacteria bacterium]|nr:hypothetical protein [Acidobacteriota bacterium]